MELVWLRTKPNGRFELIFGERRLNGARVAGLERISAELRDDLSPEQIATLQILENGQRAELEPLEEADAYQRLRDDFRYTPAQIAARVHRPERHVCERLMLQRLCPEARAALGEGALFLGAALAVATLEPDDQKQTLARNLQPRAGEPVPVREARLVVQSRYLRLDRAPFDVRDGTLVEGRGTCGSCPNRTGNQLSFGFGGDVPGDCCTDRACFEDKMEASWARKKAALLAAGCQVVEGADARKMFPHGFLRRQDGPELVELEDECEPITKAMRAHDEAVLAEQLHESDEAAQRAYDEADEHAAGTTWRKVLGPEVEKLSRIVVRDPAHRVHELVERRQAVEALVALGMVPEAPAAPARVRQGEGPATREAKIEALAEDLARVMVIEQLVAKAAERGPVAGVLRMIARQIMTLWAWSASAVVERRAIPCATARGEEPEHALFKVLSGMSIPDTVALIVELLVVASELDFDEPEAPLGVATRFYGIDLGKIRKAALKKARAQVEAETAPADGTLGVSCPECGAAPGETCRGARKTHRARARVAAGEACRVCACTEARACAGGCSWAAAGLCSTCHDGMGVALELLGVGKGTGALDAELVADELGKRCGFERVRADLVLRELEREGRIRRRGCLVELPPAAPRKGVKKARQREATP